MAVACGVLVEVVLMVLLGGIEVLQGKFLHALDLFEVVLCCPSAHYYVKYHHENETYGKAYGAQVRVLAFAGFGDKLFHHDVEHGTGGKGQHVGQHGSHQRGLQARQTRCPCRPPSPSTG